MDRLFIQIIKMEFPELEAIFSVRGKPILNDETKEDASQIKMQEVATVMF